MAGDWWILCLHQRMRPLWSGLHDTLRPDSLEGGRWAPGWCRCFLIHPVSADCPGLLWALLNSLRLKPNWVVGFVSFSSLLRVVMASIGAARDGFMHLPELFQTIQLLIYWLKVISKWRDWLSSARIFRIQGTLFFFYIKSKMWSCCLRNSHSWALFA